MTRKISTRSPLGRARGLGSAKSGLEEWLSEQFATLAFLPLGLYVLISFLAHVAFKSDYVSALAWLHTPCNAIAMILLILAATWHGYCDLVTGIVEDYIHHKVWHMASLLALKSGAFVVALTGTLSVLKIMLGA